MISDHFTNIQGLILDMDGVLWHDSEPLGDLPAIFRKIEATGLKVILVTNNATRTIAEYHTKLKRFGVELQEWQVITSGQAVGIYLQKTYPDGADIYVVGQPSLKATLADLNFRVIGEDETSADVVVVSLDYGLTYEKLRHASLLIQNGSFFVGTNPDMTLPTPGGLIPGAGTIISALEIAMGKKAYIVGKPEPALYEIALERLNLTPENALAVGDRLETDIKGAEAVGMHTALVLSGASTLSQAREYHPQPELIINNLTELIF